MREHRPRGGIHWRRLFDTPFLANGPPNSWNASESGHPGILEDGGRTFLFFQGDGDKGRTWTIAMTEIGWRNGRPVIGAVARR